MNEADKESDKDDVFRSASINAWIQSKMERDKALLNLSSGAIGLLVTFLQFSEKIESACFYYIAFSSFLICVVSIIVIFNRNASYIAKLLSPRDNSNDKILGLFDYTAIIFFSIGIFFTILIGISKIK